MQTDDEKTPADQPDDQGTFRDDRRSLERQVQSLPDNPFARWRGYLSHLADHDIDQIVEEMRGR